MEKTGTISSFVMSCRVFQRKLELAILYALNQLAYNELKFKYILTKRNHPFLKFAEGVADLKQKDNFIVNYSKIKNQLIEINDLFEINIK